MGYSEFMTEFESHPAIIAFFCLTVIFAMPAQSAAERIYYRDGKIDTGKILYRWKGSIWVARNNGSVGIPMSSIKRIEDDDGEPSKYDYETIVVLIQQLIIAQRYERAVTLCDRLIESFPDSAHIRLLRAALNQKLGNVQKATEDYSRLMNSKAADAAVYNDQGVIFAAAKDLVRANECFLEAIKLMPDLPQAHGNLAAIYMKSKDYSRAIEEYTQVLNIEPSNVNALYNLGIAFRDSGDIPKARAAWEKVLTISPEDPDTKNALAQTSG
jgi:tetratricopeptide (TPR) repeat protein